MKASARPKPRIEAPPGEAAQPGEVRRVPARHSPWLPFEDRRRDRDLKREAVLLTAARLFIEEGYTRATLADVAERLHITKPALYHYFRSKEDILFECYRLGQETVDTALARIAGSEANGLGKVRAFILAYVEAMCVDPGAMMVRVDDRELAPERRGQVRRWKREIEGSLRGFLLEGVADGSITGIDDKAVAYATFGALNGIGHWYRPDAELKPTEIGRRYADLLTNGLAVRSGDVTATKRARTRRPKGNVSREG